MARRVYFAFHYQRDIFRVNVVRNAHIVEGVAAAGFSDGSLWEKTRLQGDAAIKRLIDRGLEGTSVTAVLIGAQTAQREYVQYEIDKSWERGNGLLGIYIHNIPQLSQGRDVPGKDPFAHLGYTGIRTYDWVNDDGYNNFGAWVEAAAVQPRKSATPTPAVPSPLLSALRPQPSIQATIPNPFLPKPEPSPLLAAYLKALQNPPPPPLPPPDPNPGLSALYRLLAKKPPFE